MGTVEIRCGKTGDVAKLLNVTPHYVRKLANEGYFGEAAFKIGNTAWRYNIPMIEERFGLATAEEVNE